MTFRPGDKLVSAEDIQRLDIGEGELLAIGLPEVVGGKPIDDIYIKQFTDFLSGWLRINKTRLFVHVGKIEFTKLKVAQERPRVSRRGKDKGPAQG